MRSRHWLTAGLAFSVCVWLAPPAAADYSEAQAARRRGDYSAAYQACKTAAETGDAQCQNYLGVLYERGLGVAPDLTEAIRLFRLAAAQGHADAENNIGAAYQLGRGVPRNEREAARWYSMAADRGHAGAQNNLAVLYATGSGIPRTPTLALELFRRAAVNGHLPAIFNFARALADGLDAPTDSLGAYLWYSIASRLSSDVSGRDKAELARVRLATALSPSELGAARQIAETWRPGDGDPRASLAVALGAPTSAGSGFIVSHAGDVVTNNHVIKDCRKFTVIRDGAQFAATLIAVERDADLAILRLPESVASIASLRAYNSIKPGEAVAVVSFPLQGLLSSETSITTGIISALEGPRNDQRLLQMTAPVQPGSSGGPLVDESGAVVGVVVGKLSSSRVAATSGQAPENVNFAINVRYLRTLLDKNGVGYEIITERKTLSTPEIAERAGKYTVMVRCSL